MNYFIGFMLVILLSGCTTAGIENVEKIKSGSSIAPLSLMGNSSEICLIGTTVFSNERRTIEVPEWQIDKYAESVASHLLEGNKKFIVLRPDTTTARAAFKNTDQLAALDSKVGAEKTAMLKLANDAGADYLLVIWPALFGDPFFGTNQTFSGYGVYERSFFGVQQAANFLTLKVSLFDGKTGEELARSSGFLKSPRPDESWMESNNLKLSDADNQATRRAIEQLIEGLTKTLLGNVKLIPSNQ